eukprot:TRINITY_DN355_c0_g1_i1.p1 TRINITY_DN355_c0_g1~~TRINITY_DN355_c0_g1_i1.p1  ORF type:complete len:172 (+),score=42.41 TRINITY_DN355_c0_g1_i1:89-604(+)
MGNEVAKESPFQSIYDIKVKDNHENEVDMSKYKGKVLLIVNVASSCGYTDVSYKQMTELHQKYRDRGFEVLAFPCNQFLYQERGTNSEIQEFCTKRYSTDFPIFDKIKVNGDEQHDLYGFLKAKHPGKIGWNFVKFLVDRDGNVVKRYATKSEPKSFENDIVELLDKPASS